MSRIRWAAAFLIVIAAAGCNATGATQMPAPATSTVAPATTPGASTPTVSTPTALRGTWTSDVEGTTASSGVWTLVISESNLSLQNPVGGDPFTLDPTSISETAMALPAAADCPDQSAVTPGTYVLALTGDSLRITVTSDSCGDRQAVLTAGAWTRKR